MSDRPATADALVVFGITGDLARKMTFRSLYRLERARAARLPGDRRGGRATGRRPAARARARVDRRPPASRSTSACSSASPQRLSLRQRRLRRRRDLRARRRTALGDATQPRLLPRDPAVAVRDGGRGAGRGRAASQSGQRVVVEKPFGHDLAVGARAGRATCTSTSTSPSSTGSTTSWARWGSRRSSTCGSPTRCSSRCGTATTSPRVQITMAENVRRRGPRPLLRPGRRAARRRRQPPAAAARRRGDGAAVGRRPRHAQGRQAAPCSRRCPTPSPSTTSAASTRATATSTACAPTRTTETYAALRLEIDNWRWAGRAVLHPHRQAAAAHPDRAAAACSSTAPRLHFIPGGRRRPEPSQIVFRIDPHTGIRIVARRAARRPAGRQRDRARHGVRAGGRRGRHPLRGAAARRARRRQQPLHPPGQRRGVLADRCSRCSTRRPGAPLRRRAPGAREADEADSPGSAAGAVPGCPSRPSRLASDDRGAGRSSGLRTRVEAIRETRRVRLEPDAASSGLIVRSPARPSSHHYLSARSTAITAALAVSTACWRPDCCGPQPAASWGAARAALALEPRPTDAPPGAMRPRPVARRSADRRRRRRPAAPRRGGGLGQDRGAEQGVELGVQAGAARDPEAAGRASAGGARPTCSARSRRRTRPGTRPAAPCSSPSTVAGSAVASRRRRSALGRGGRLGRLLLRPLDLLLGGLEALDLLGDQAGLVAVLVVDPARGRARSSRCAARPRWPASALPKTMISTDASRSSSVANIIGSPFLVRIFLACGDHPADRHPVAVAAAGELGERAVDLGPQRRRRRP